MSVSNPSQTRRRLGGRQPLWGIGVRSRISVILKPVEANARTRKGPRKGQMIKRKTETGA